MAVAICKSCVQEFDTDAGHDCPGLAAMETEIEVEADIATLAKVRTPTTPERSDD